MGAASLNRSAIYQEIPRGLLLPVKRVGLCLRRHGEHPDQGVPLLRLLLADPGEGHKAMWVWSGAHRGNDALYEVRWDTIAVGYLRDDILPVDSLVDQPRHRPGDVWGHLLVGEDPINPGIGEKIPR